MLGTGCRWRAVPRRLGSGATLHRYFREWDRRGVFEKLESAGLMRHAN